MKIFGTCSFLSIRKRYFRFHFRMADSLFYTRERLPCPKANWTIVIHAPFATWLKIVARACCSSSPLWHRIDQIARQDIRTGTAGLLWFGWRSGGTVRWQFDLDRHSRISPGE